MYSIYYTQCHVLYIHVYDVYIHVGGEGRVGEVVEVKGWSKDSEVTYTLCTVYTVHVSSLVPRLSLLPRNNSTYDLGRVKGHTWIYCAEGGRAWE